MFPQHPGKIKGGKMALIESNELISEIKNIKLANENTAEYFKTINVRTAHLYWQKVVFCEEIIDIIKKMDSRQRPSGMTDGKEKN